MKDIDFNNPEEVRALCKELDQLDGALRPFFRLLWQEEELTANDRKSLGARCFPTARELVRAVVYAFKYHGELYPDMRGYGERLEALQELANRLNRMRCRFISLLGACADLFLMVQVHAAYEALGVVRRVAEEGERPYRRPANHERRELHLRRAADLAPVKGGAAIARRREKEIKKIKKDAREQGTDGPSIREAIAALIKKS